MRALARGRPPPPPPPLPAAARSSRLADAAAAAIAAPRRRSRRRGAARASTRRAGCHADERVAVGAAGAAVVEARARRAASAARASPRALVAQPTRSVTPRARAPCRGEAMPTAAAASASSSAAYRGSNAASTAAPTSALATCASGAGASASARRFGAPVLFLSARATNRRACRGARALEHAREQPATRAPTSACASGASARARHWTRARVGALAVRPAARGRVAVLGVDCAERTATLRPRRSARACSGARAPGVPEKSSPSSCADAPRSRGVRPPRACPPRGET